MIASKNSGPTWHRGLARAGSSARANTFGACYATCFADNGTHTFYYYGLTEASIAGMEHARLNALDAPTQMTTVLLAAQTSLTDVVAYDDYFGNQDEWANVWGKWECVSWNINIECEKGYVWLNYTYLNSASALRRQWISCQEVGHSAGLGHETGGNACMRNPYDANSYPLLSVHSIGHVNSRSDYLGGTT